LNSIARGKWVNLLYRIGLALGLSFLALQTFSTFRNLSDFSYSQISWGNLIACGVLILCAYFVQLAAWKEIMASISINLGWGETISGYPLSFIPRYIPGSVWGYLSRSEWLSNDHSIPRAISYRGSILELLAIVFANLFYSLQFFLNPDISTLNPVNLPIIIPYMFITFGLAKLIDTRIAKTQLFELGKQQMGNVKLQFSHWLHIQFLLLLMWLLYGLALQRLTSGLFASPNHFSLSTLAVSTIIYSLSWFIGFIVFFIPAGMGLREASLSSFMTSNFSFSLSQATMIALIFRAWMLIIESLMVIISLMYRWRMRLHAPIKSE